MLKTVEYIVENGEDAGKVFEISAFSAFAGDKWARHVVKALSQAATKIPKETFELGMAGLAGLELAGQGLQIFSYMSDDEQDKALDALLDLCKIKRQGQIPSKILDVDIQDPMTLIELRTRAFTLNVDFIRAGIRQISMFVATLLDNWAVTTNASGDQQNTKTSAKS